MLPFVFVAILLVGAVLGLLMDDQLRRREAAFGDALERHPVAAEVVEDIAERNQLDLRDIVRSVPKASPEDFDAALGALEQRRMTVQEFEAAIAPER
jgi:hypothetical protein